MSRKLVKIEENILKLKQCSKINIIGDPGCDGLGAATMSVFAKALNDPQPDFTIIAGDLVPSGLKQLYKNVIEFINTIAKTHVYSLCGNHDTDYYCDFFGKRNYALDCGNVAFIVLDNSSREFSSETLEFFNNAAEKISSENIVILFHIPPPNSNTGNSISRQKWNEFRELYLPYKNRIKCFITGHVHSFFEDGIDDIPIIVTGGGGADIEYVNDEIEKEHIGHHILQLEVGTDNSFSYKKIDIDDFVYDKELQDKQIAEYLNSAFLNEITAYFKYRAFAEQAAVQGYSGVAALFNALSDSEYHHAKNHYMVSNKMKNLSSNLADSIAAEKYEIDVMYKDYYQYAAEQSHGLAKYTFFDSFEAEKIHKKLLDKAKRKIINNEDIEEVKYFTCSSCGFTLTKKSKGIRCPLCGAPDDKIYDI